MAEYVKEVEREAAKVYALFSLCEKYGIDPYAEEVEEEITAQVELSIQGSETEYGYGSVKAYLKEIGEQFLNDSVYRLYLRYDICERLLSAKLKKDEVITAKWEDVFAYYRDTYFASDLDVEFLLREGASNLQYSYWPNGGGDWTQMSGSFLSTSSMQRLVDQNKVFIEDCITNYMIPNQVALAGYKSAGYFD